MKELFMSYEEVGGYKSIVRFMKFIELKCKNKSKVKKLKKLFDMFEDSILKNDFKIEKSYLNFRSFVFSLEV